METVFCFYCGARLNEGMTTCPACGVDNSVHLQNRKEFPSQFQSGTFGTADAQQQGQYVQINGQYGQQGGQQNMQDYGQPQYPQQQYGQQQYYPQNITCLPNGQLVQQPTMGNKIAGFIMCMLGFPLTFAFGLGTLGALFDGEIAGMIVCMILAGLSALLSWTGIKQFKVRPFNQRPMIMPTPVQQPYNQGMQQYGQGMQYGQGAQQYGQAPYGQPQPMLQQPNAQIPNQPFQQQTANIPQPDQQQYGQYNNNNFYQ